MESSREKMGVNLPLVIDRTRLAGHSLTFTQYVKAKEKFSQLNGLKLAEGSIKYADSVYTSRLHYGLGKNEAIAAVEVRALPNMKCALIYEIWPHRATGTRFQEFHGAITSLLKGDAFNYNEVFNQGHVQSIEYASDYTTRPMHSFIPWTARAKKSGIFKKEVMNDYKGTIYIGTKKSPIRFSIYDKALKMEKDGMPNPLPTRTRIEAIVFEPYLPGSLVQRLRPCELDKQLNPFRFLEIADLDKARKLSSDPDWHQFLDIATAEGGAPEAFKELTKEERLQTRERLRDPECQALWWNPDHAWAGHFQANAAIHPATLLP